jgi:serine O-acetyltransferase
MPLVRLAEWQRHKVCGIHAMDRIDLIATLRQDLGRTYAYLDGSRWRRLAGCLGSPGVHAVVVYRFGQWARLQRRVLRCLLDPLYWTCSVLVRIAWGISLPRSASIGPGLFIGHFGGITISHRAVLGRNCNLSQGITIGVSGHGARCGVPVIGDDVYIAPGACVFGKITIGNNVKIGANAVIYKDVPDNAVAVMDPGFRIISYAGNRTVSELSRAREQRRNASSA